jgi:hypothetical protein
MAAGTHRNKIFRELIKKMNIRKVMYLGGNFLKTDLAEKLIPDQGG